MTMENGRRRDLKRAMNSTMLNTKLFSREGGKEGRGEMGERDGRKDAWEHGGEGEGRRVEGGGNKLTRPQVLKVLLPWELIL